MGTPCPLPLTHLLMSTPFKTRLSIPHQSTKGKIIIIIKKPFLIYFCCRFNIFDNKNKIGFLDYT